MTSPRSKNNLVVQCLVCKRRGRLGEKAPAGSEKAWWGPGEGNSYCCDACRTRWNEAAQAQLEPILKETRDLLKELKKLETKD